MFNRTSTTRAAALLAAMAGGMMMSAGPAQQNQASAGTEARAVSGDAYTRAGDKMRGAQRAVEASMLRSIFGGRIVVRPEKYPRRTPAWTNASYQRAELKRRNRARHRAACKQKG